MKAKKGDKEYMILQVEEEFTIEEEFTNEESAGVQKNHKAMNILICTIDPSEFNRVSTCETTKDM